MKNIIQNTNETAKNEKTPLLSKMPKIGLDVTIILGSRDKNKIVLGDNESGVRSYKGCETEIDKKLSRTRTRKKLWAAVGCLFLGQMLAACNAVSGILNQTLNERTNVPLPAFQTALNYIFLCLTYGLYQLQQHGSSLLLSVDGAKCFISAVIDVEAWYYIYKSYHYTSLTSIQSLDCLAIPVAIVISRLLLHKVYHWLQYTAVLVSLVGVMLIVYSDYDPRDPSSVEGDVMCAVGAVLFGISTVCQEWIVEDLDTYRYMGTVCWYAGLVSALKVGVLEGDALVSTFTQYPKLLVWIGCLAVSQFIFYSIMPVMLSKYGCGAATINILAADVYAAIAGAQLFSLSYDAIYLTGMSVTCVGILLYTLKSDIDVRTDDDEEKFERFSTTSSSMSKLNSNHTN